MIPNAPGCTRGPPPCSPTSRRAFQSAISFSAATAGERPQRDRDHGAGGRPRRQGAGAWPADPTRSRGREAREVLAEGCGDEGCTPAPAPAPLSRPRGRARTPRASRAIPNLLLGVPASPGLAVGEVFQVRRAEIPVTEAGRGVDTERRQLADAIATAQGQLAALRAQLHAKADPAKAAIFAAHEELLDDPDLLEIAESAIAKGQERRVRLEAGGHDPRRSARGPPQRAARAARERSARRGAPRARAADGRGASGSRTIRPNTVLIAEDLTPSDTASLDRSRVVGLLHDARRRHLARGDPRALARHPGAGRHRPGRARRAERHAGRARRQQRHAAAAPRAGRKSPAFASAQARAERRRQTSRTRWSRPSRATARASRSSPTSAGSRTPPSRRARRRGRRAAALRVPVHGARRRADGGGAVRDLHGDRGGAGPDRPLIMRTLDVGGDKPLAYLPMPKEDNPFLGVRGIRVGLDRPEILRTQLRAILRAAAFGRVQHHVPDGRDAGRAARRQSDARGRSRQPRRAADARRDHGGSAATAVMAAQFAREADFFSIGTNDLTQYTLAMDRGHPKLAPQVDGLNPAVLRLIAQTASGAQAQALGRRLRRDRERPARACRSCSGSASTSLPSACRRFPRSRRTSAR